MLFLVKNGIPWDVANELDYEERSAYVIILQQFEGGEFDWGRAEWKRRD